MSSTLCCKQDPVENKTQNSYYILKWSNSFDFLVISGSLYLLFRLSVYICFLSDNYKFTSHRTVTEDLWVPFLFVCGCCIFLSRHNWLVFYFTGIFTCTVVFKLIFIYWHRYILVENKRPFLSSSRIPSHVLIIVPSSKVGDFFKQNCTNKRSVIGVLVYSIYFEGL